MYGLWFLGIGLRHSHLKECFQGWVPQSVFSLGNGLSWIEAWFSTALEIEEVLAGAGSDQLHVLVADVMKSYDIVDRFILDCSLGRLGLPSWFRKVYFSFHSQARSGFKLAAVPGWCIPQGCPLSMVFIVALYVPWYWKLEAIPGVKPQLYANNLKCSAGCPRALFAVAWFVAQYVR